MKIVCAVVFLALLVIQPLYASNDSIKICTRGCVSPDHHCQNLCLQQLTSWQRSCRYDSIPEDCYETLNNNYRQCARSCGDEVVFCVERCLKPELVASPNVILDGSPSAVP